MARKTKAVAEFGDFQTPDELARRVVALTAARMPHPASIIEPSCGTGSFLHAAAKAFPNSALMGLEINPEHISVARQRMNGHSCITFTQGSFFSHDWRVQIANMPSPILIIGNPPWVTNAELGFLGSENLPEKNNFQRLSGIDAITGKSNFDISEWMLIQNLEWLREKKGSLAVLCKISVARKVLVSAWKRGWPIADARIYRIDALEHFGASVNACLLTVQASGEPGSTECAIYPSIESAEPSARFGYVANALVSDLEAYLRFCEFLGSGGPYRWRSGLKHDCSRIMELERTPTGWSNGLGEVVQLEDDYVFPLRKSSDIAGVRHRSQEKFVIVPQRFVGEDTKPIKRVASLTWEYLSRHRAILNARTSSIYKGKPEFSVFGVGDYTFAPWKIAISGLYKKLTFKVFGPQNGKPVIFDDTVYFLPFENQYQADRALAVFNSEPAQTLLGSMVFWDEKRPITAGLLNRIDLPKIARFLGQTSAADVVGVWQERNVDHQLPYS